MIVPLGMLWGKKNANAKFLSKIDPFQSSKDSKIFKSSMERMLISKLNCLLKDRVESGPALVHKRSGPVSDMVRGTFFSVRFFGTDFRYGFFGPVRATLVEGGSFRILYDGQELRRSDQIQISQVGFL